MLPSRQSLWVAACEDGAADAGRLLVAGEVASERSAAEGKGRGGGVKRGRGEGKGGGGAGDAQCTVRHIQEE